MQKIIGLVAIAVLAGCGDASTGDDAGAVDTGVGPVDSGGADASTGDDAGSGDDAGPTDAGEPDSGPIPGAPTCTITAPATGAEVAFDEDVTFVATADDPEDGALSGASVVWRSDLVTAPLGSGLSVTTALTPPGAHTITCTATDSDGNTGSDTITVTSLSPVAAIFHPGDGEVRPAASSIPFVGEGRDLEDGALTGAALVWTSSLDGAIGTGGSFNASLSAGTNVITLTVTDSDGNTASDTLTLTITP
jgi:hypothetical protein